MITNRMRRMSKRRQKIELARQARLIAQAVELQAVDLNDGVVKAAHDPSVINVVGEQRVHDPSAAPVAP